MRLLLSMTLAGGMVLPAAGAAAQSSSAPSAPMDGRPHGMIAIGVGAAPEYDGAENFRAVPLVLGDVRWGDVNLEFRGLRLRADLAPDSRLSFGPVIGARFSRDDDVDGPVGLLPEIDHAIEAGAFVGYRFGGDRTGQGSIHAELSIVGDVSDVHDGVLATASASYAAIRRPEFQLSFDVQTTWADGDFMRTYFGVEEAGAEASGLAVYRPESGVRDIGLGLTASYWFDQRIGVIGRLGATYLLGDAADSPIVEEGERWQPMAGIALSYRF